MMFLPYRPIRALPNPTAPAVKLQEVATRYGHTTALEEISLVVPVGVRLALVGANGAGKSTLLKLLAGLLLPTSGEIQLFGHPVALCAHRLVYLPQRSEIAWRFPMTVRRLVGTGRYVQRGWLRGLTKEDERVVDESLERMGILDLAEKQIGRLSGGQQQRVLLARALAQSADLLLLDEPLNAVDSSTRELISQILADLADEHKTVIVATHDIGRLDTEYDAVVYLSGGKQIASPTRESTHHHDH